MLTSSVPARVVTSAEHASAVGHGDADLAEVAGAGDARRAGWRGPRGPARAPRAARRGRRRRRSTRTSVERGEQAVEHIDDGGAVLGADVGPDARVAGGDARHVAEPAGRQAQQGAMLGCPVIGHPHERRGGEVRHVGDDSHEGVVVIGRQRHDVGSELAR